MKITIAQLNPVIGDIEGNLKKIENALSQCLKDQSDLVIFSELFLVGYPPRDILKRPRLVEQVQKAIQEILLISKNQPHTGILFGAPIPTEIETGHGLYNSALLIYQGKIIYRQNKSLLPTYDVFDEARYFDSAPEIGTVQFKDEMLGISICEDAWNDQHLSLTILHRKRRNQVPYSSKSC
jgi:NAD+ synthase (glutamine-hydrolysing)